MKSLGKPQDGWIARNLDRRISSRISRWLIRLGARPFHATILAFLFGLAGSAIVLRGDYVSVLLGTILLYAFSVLDGCDGEIARACYLDSPNGRRLDLIGDTLVNVIFLVCLGFGLSRAMEGIAAGLLIVVTEAMLFVTASTGPTGDSGENSRYLRHEQMVRHSGLWKLPPRVVETFGQLTKRDVGWVLFVVLAAVNAPAFILHLSLGIYIILAIVAALAVIRGALVTRGSV
jgi:CDP-L-myo-inositol myo-inositolphosphotransferase